MCIDVEIADILNHIPSHKWPEMEDEQYRNAVHVVDIYAVAWHFGYAMTQFETKRILGHPNGLTYELPKFDLRPYLKTQIGILTGKGISGQPHAVAWDPVSQKVYDPNYSIYDLDYFKVDDFYAVTKRM